MNKFREILEDSLSLASSGKWDEALDKLNGGAKEAADANDQEWAALLAKNAGLLFERTGQIEQAKASYSMAINYEESDPYLHYSLAKTCETLGHDAEARHHFEASYRLATEQGDEDLLKILEKSTS